MLLNVLCYVVSQTSGLWHLSVDGLVVTKSPAKQ